MSSSPQTWVILSSVIFLSVVTVHLFIWQGPLLQWGDARLPLLLLTVLAGLALTMRRIEIAAMTAALAATTALVAAIFGGISQLNLFEFGDNLALATKPASELRGPLEFGFFIIFMFAGVWAVFGLNSRVGAARFWWARVFWTLVTIAVAVIGAMWSISLYGDHVLLWGVYSAGVTIAVTVFAGVILSKLASNSFLIPVMTDSARYFSREPEHVVARQKIRDAGVRLLDKLHDPASKYERVIVVAHSLGTAVGYELLADYWSRQSGAYVIRDGDNVDAALVEVERAGRALNQAQTAEERTEALRIYRQAQRKFSVALKGMTVSPTTHGHAEGKNWLISDFITLGSPLTHASLLLADHKGDLWDKQRARTLAACPPTMFNEKGAFDFEAGGITFRGWDKAKRPIHSAVFAPVRWTNHYFKTGEWIIQGDVIGGPIAPPMPRRRQRGDPHAACGDLGRGVLDVEVERSGTGKLFAHNEYWRSDLTTSELCQCLTKAKPKPQHIAALIAALDLEDMASGTAPVQVTDAMASDPDRAC